MTLPSRGGLTLVETIVAMAVLAINVVGWSALVHLVVVLLQRTAAVLELLDVPDLVAMCSAGVLCVAPWRSRPTEPYGTITGPDRGAPRRGLTLVEMLVALAIASLLFGLVAAAFGSTSRFARAALASGDALTVRLALPTMLQQAIQVAGRGVREGCGLGVDDSGRRLVVTSTLADGTLVVDEVFAALDGGGRPALYLRRVPHARQPWLEDVTSFRVQAHELDRDDRVASVELVLEHLALADPLAVHVTLPHRPCLEGAP
jgi:prepilin-type N-terminal cleavage/methylation domain-containing protein